MLESLANSKSKENIINANEAAKETKAFVKKNENIKNKIVLSNKNNHNKAIIKYIYIKYSILISISLVFLLYNNKRFPDDFHTIRNTLRRTEDSSNPSISMIFRGKGTQNIWNKVEVNGTLVSFNTNDKNVNFSDVEKIYEIKITWLDNATNINTLIRAFSNLDGLISIDFSKFHFDKIGDMSDMFANCSNLESITFSSNINTNNLSNVYGMFYNCIVYPALILLVLLVWKTCSIIVYL